MKDTRLHPVLEEAFRALQVKDDQGNLIPLDSNISSEEAILLDLAIRQIQPVRSVEIGLAKGISTVAILNAISVNGIGTHVVLDPFQHQYGNAGIEMVKRSGLEAWWVFHRNFAEYVIPNLDSIQFAFIDASHLFDLSLAEFVLVDKKLDVGGVIGFHDMWMPSLQKLLHFILLNRSYEVWYPSGYIPQHSSSIHNLKTFVYRQFKNLPFARKVLAPELISAFDTKSLNNLVLIKKTAHDSRDWRHYIDF